MNIDDYDDMGAFPNKPMYMVDMKKNQIPLSSTSADTVALYELYYHFYLEDCTENYYTNDTDPDPTKGGFWLFKTMVEYTTIFDTNHKYPFLNDFCILMISIIKNVNDNCISLKIPILFDKKDQTFYGTLTRISESPFLPIYLCITKIEVLKRGCRCYNTEVENEYIEYWTEQYPHVVNIYKTYLLDA